MSDCMLIEPGHPFNFQRQTDVNFALNNDISVNDQPANMDTSQNIEDVYYIYQQ